MAAHTLARRVADGFGPSAPKGAERRSRLPLSLKLLYTAFLAVLVPSYLRDYGPTNFLYFCDVALLMTFIAIWSEKSLWASMPAVGITLPQLIWTSDFVAGLFGTRITGTAAYMFSPAIDLFTRALSFFHLWLPILLLGIVWRLGYDKRAFVAWTLLAWTLMLICYYMMPAPPSPNHDPNVPVNINNVYGLNDNEPQHWMPPLIWLAGLMCFYPLVFYFPAHLLLSKFCRTHKTEAGTTCDEQARRTP
jgi:hypothetical protein